MNSNFKSVKLPNRGVLRIAGEDTKKLLDGILTCDLDRVSDTAARYGALLTPQGKLLYDFIIIAAPPPEDDAYYVDCPRPVAAEFAKRLNFYKLRAKMQIEDLSSTYGITASWGAVSADAGFPDPRLAALGRRTIAPDGQTGDVSDAKTYLEHRLALGVPDILEDFGLGDSFPHDMLLDELHGVDFDKGCYVGQEVVSRMRHRGTARTRVMRVRFEGATPPGKSSELMADGKSIGRMGSSTADGGIGVALVRLDRAADALARHASIEADGVRVTIAKPAYASFVFPPEAAS